MRWQPDGRRYLRYDDTWSEGLKKAYEIVTTMNQTRGVDALPWPKGTTVEGVGTPKRSVFTLPCGTQLRPLGDDYKRPVEEAKVCIGWATVIEKESGRVVMLPFVSMQALTGATVEEYHKLLLGDLEPIVLGRVELAKLIPPRTMMLLRTHGALARELWCTREEAARFVQLLRLTLK